MSRYSDEERRRIIAETYATLQRGAAAHEEPSAVPELPPEDVLIEALSQPLEDRVARWKAEADAQTAREQRAVRERRRGERRAEPAPINWDLNIAEAIAEERGFLLEVLAETVAELADRQREAIDAAMLPLRTELAQVRAEAAEQKVTICELRLTLSEQLSADRSKIIDLPPLPMRSRVN
ncbi:hypothetical protein [Bradyrhizobium japonicum]|uniref:hypothetical protein n=1 Tax=Bradyrhizobium japonicum TaxID=375 RepID=UPI001E3197F6|nr:hypothetical protein [Bradyrhizobium japonicum]MCD9110093.1 hypothetical protein [Bradyrhizobium japonicum]MCD9817075.1 hypothetical protein [Bradyrhizobium japonicum]MCD9891715.1 hypothetical protein [Bradyrhizobium japonicum]MCS3982684.1 hypothetical protein [Bradyrhizobium japonicum]MEB2670737.1 hypothetical protein [Bradyrhizobium japonicum]